VDIRVIATTNRSLREAVESGRFREDLYYRLNVFPVTLPPLRERPSDIPLLARHFAQEAASRNGVRMPVLSDAALAELTGRRWRGNVRELENVMERAVLLANGGAIGPEHLGAEERGADRAAGPAGAGMRPRSLWEVEREHILHMLNNANGNRTHAAKRLGISIRTLRNKLREYRQQGLEDGAAPAAEE
jgi:two-component system response regulator FlrC